MKLFGIVRHSPDEVIVELLTINKRPHFHFSPFGMSLPVEGVKEKFIIVPNANDFKRFYRILNTPVYKNKIVFVFGSELSLVEYSDLVFLDAERTTPVDVTPTGNLNIGLVTSSPSISLVKRKLDIYVNTLIEETLKNSVFNDLMTFIYTLPAKTHQKPITVMCCSYLRLNLTLKQLTNYINRLRKVMTITTRVEEALVTILTTEVADRIRVAFTELPSYDRDLIEEIAEKHDVSAFELSYVIKMLENEKEYINHTKESIDDKMRKK